MKPGMTQQIKKKNPWKMRLIIIGLLGIIAVAAIYWVVATDSFADTSNRKAAFTVNALDLIHEFEANDSAANKKYTNQIITVNGTVSEVEAVDTTMNIKFIDSVNGSYIIFAFQEQHLAEAKSIKAGDIVSIKGSCSGSITSEILGNTSISFKRSALNK